MCRQAVELDATGLRVLSYFEIKHSIQKQRPDDVIDSDSDADSDDAATVPAARGTPAAVTENQSSSGANQQRPFRATDSSSDDASSIRVSPVPVRTSTVETETERGATSQRTEPSEPERAPEPTQADEVQGDVKTSGSAEHASAPSGQSTGHVASGSRGGGTRRRADPREPERRAQATEVNELQGKTNAGYHADSGEEDDAAGIAVDYTDEEPEEDADPASVNVSKSQVGPTRCKPETTRPEPQPTRSDPQAAETATHGNTDPGHKRPFQGKTPPRERWPPRPTDLESRRSAELKNSTSGVNSGQDAAGAKDPETRAGSGGVGESGARGSPGAGDLYPEIRVRQHSGSKATTAGAPLPRKRSDTSGQGRSQSQSDRREGRPHGEGHTKTGRQPLRNASESQGETRAGTRNDIRTENSGRAGSKPRVGSGSRADNEVRTGPEPRARAGSGSGPDFHAHAHAHGASGTRRHSYVRHNSRENYTQPGAGTSHSCSVPTLGKTWGKV